MCVYFALFVFLLFAMYEALIPFIFVSFLAQDATKDKVVITMTMNAGMTDLVSNFYCSARRAGGTHLHEAGQGISIDHLVLFPTDDEVRW